MSLPQNLGWKRFVRQIFALSAMLAVAPSLWAKFTVCNTAADTLMMAIAIGANQGDQAQVAGWVTLPRGCSPIIRKDVTGTPLWVFARDYAGRLWTGDREFCVSDSDFVTSSADCQHDQQLTRVRFSHVDTARDDVQITFSRNGVQISSISDAPTDNAQSPPKQNSFADLVTSTIQKIAAAETDLKDGEFRWGRAVKVKYRANVGRAVVHTPYAKNRLEITIPISFQITASRRMAGAPFLASSCGTKDPRLAEVSFVTVIGNSVTSTLTKVEFVKACRLAVVGDISKTLERALRPEAERMLAAADRELEKQLSAPVFSAEHRP